MTPNEQDVPEASQENTATELSPFSAACAPGAGGDATSGVPLMEQLPGYDALPDPGYPEMPPPAAVPSVADDPVSRSAEGAEAEPHPPVWPPTVPTFTPAQSATPAGPETSPQAPGAPTLPQSPKQVYSPDPYAAPRAPGEAPPLHGPSVPWSEVRAAADYEAAGEEPSAPPDLPPYAPPHAAPQAPAHTAGPEPGVLWPGADPAT
ncbi:MAG: hypothetical protein ACRDNW_00655, partial [Trebonia sp.]